MIALMFAAAALANSITAPYGIKGHADWGATRPNIRLTLQNQSKVKAWLVDISCNVYDAQGALVAVSTGNLPELEPGERAQTWALSDAAAAAAAANRAVRFACKVDVSAWRRPG